MFVNCTAHRITVYAREDVSYNPVSGSYRADEHSKKLLVLPGSPNQARCSDKTVEECLIDGIQVLEIGYSSIRNLPDPVEGVLYITSVVVAREAKKLGRTDVLIPAKLVRDLGGRVIGCLAFARV